MTATPEATPAPAKDVAFKVFNQGGRIFSHHELQLLPGRFTEVPAKYADAVRKLLVDYKTELVSADTAQELGRNQAGKVNELTAENASLKKQIEKLQSILLQDDKDVAARAEKAETDLKIAQQEVRLASGRITQLEQMLARANDQVKTMTADVDRLTRPPG